MRKSLVGSCLALAACGEGHGWVPDARRADAVRADAATDADDAPRPAPDLRFRWVGASPTFRQPLTTAVTFYEGSGGSLSLPPGDYSWSPVLVSATNPTIGHYSWSVTQFAPAHAVEPVLATVESGRIEILETQLAPHLDRGAVLISLDILPDAYAFVTSEVAAGPALGYAATPVDVSRAALDGWVESEGAAGRVVTALSASPTAGLIRAYSFARAGDPTPYVTRVVSVTSTTLVADATALATDGYIITAFGRVGDDAFVMVGTRTADAAPRSITVQRGGLGVPDLRRGGALVAWVYDGDWVVILEH